MASSFMSQVRALRSYRMTPLARPPPARRPPAISAESAPAVLLRVLRAYIRDADGAAASDLSVSLSGGSLTLRNFELNLPVPPHVRVAVRRAWVGELRVSIPWAALGSHPVAVALHGVRVHVEATGGGGVGGQGTEGKERVWSGGICCGKGGEEGARESGGGAGGQQGMGPKEGERGGGGGERGGDGAGKEEEGGGGGSDTDSESSQGSSSSGAGHAREELAELLALGGLRAFLQHTVLNASVTVTDVLLQYSTPSAVLSLRCDKLLLHSTAPDWTPAFVVRAAPTLLLCCFSYPFMPIFHSH
ncbi:unnamed protein product, partial [Closterium sp. NIES-65]